MTDRELSEVRPMRFGLLALVGLAVLLMAAFAFVLMRQGTPSAASLALDRKLAQLRKDGVPITAAEIGKLILDPDAEHDARLILRPAFAWTAGSRPSTNMPIVSGGSFPKRSEPVQPEAMSELATYLTNSDALLSALPAQFDGIWFSMGWTNGYTNVPLGPYVQIRQVAQALALKAFYEGEKQDSQKAADTLQKGFGLVRTLNGDVVSSTMIRVAVAGVMCDATEQVLNRTKLTDAQLLGVQKEINPAIADDFTRPYGVERHLAVTYFDSLRAAQNQGGSDHARRTLASWALWLIGKRLPVYRDEDYLLYLNVLDERRATESRPGIERLKRAVELDAHYQTNQHSLMAQMVGTHWTKCLRPALETRAKLETTKTALAVERHRFAHNGEIPESLQALVPEYLPALPRDPLDNQPLRFKKLSRGYVIYSIGADGVDNGGTERANSNVTNNYDVTFTVER